MNTENVQVAIQIEEKQNIKIIEEENPLKDQQIQLEQIEEGIEQKQSLANELAQNKVLVKIPQNAQQMIDIINPEEVDDQINEEKDMVGLAYPIQIYTLKPIQQKQFQYNEEEISIMIVDIQKVSDLQKSGDGISLNGQIKVQCLICMDYFESDKFKAIAACNHQFCEFCVTAFLEYCIKNSKVLRVNCPLEGCTEEYTEQIIHDNVSDEMFQKFKKFKHIKIVSQDPNVRWCPRIGCENYVVGSPFSLQTTLICACGQQICFSCGNVSHPNQSCDQARDKNYVYAKNKFLIFDCPKCKSPIQKNGGCNHIKCQSCNYEFCWLCRGTYNRTHWSFWNLCGCVLPGAQFSHLDPFQNVFLWKLMLLIPRIVLIIFLMCSILIVGVIYGIFSLIFVPFQCFKEIIGNSKWRRTHCCKKTIIFNLLFILGLICIPFSLIFMVVKLINKCCKKCL